MLWLFKCLYISILMCSLCVFANPEEPLVSNLTISMRDSGYTMGDVIDMTVTFRLPKNQKIDESSLPLVGRIKPWLDIQSIHIKQNNELVKINVKWQIFATVEIAQALKTPEISLKTKSKPSKQIIIPQQVFYYSPVLPMPPLKDIKRRANIVPPLFDTAKPLIFFGVCLSLFFLCAFLWLWLNNYLTWLPYQAGPMVNLSRNLIKVNANKGFNHKQLREIHAAMNKSAGISLYPDNLSKLFTYAPHFASEKKNVVDFFNQSWAQFYQDSITHQKPIDVDSTKQWIKRVAIAEQLSKVSIGWIKR